MKTSFNLAFIFLLAAFMSCTNEIDPIITPTDNLTLLKETKGGCFDEQKSTLYDTDTLFYSMVNDSLILTIDMVNNCAARLIDSLSIIDNNHVNIYIKNERGPWANCICTYEFQYFFNNNVDNDLLFVVFLKDYEEEEYSFWGQLQYP